MDPLYLCLALAPLSAYFGLIGVLNTLKRPTLLTGVWDTLALAFGVSGWVLVGPIELFLPEAAFARFGGLIWAPVFVLYGLVVLLVVLLLRPRIVIYNITAEQLRPLLAESVNEVDEKARWAGDCLTLPSIRVQLHVEAPPAARYVQLVAVGTNQDLEGWRRLTKSLNPRVRELAVGANPRGASLIVAGVAMLIAISVAVATRQPEVAEAIRDLLQQ